MKIFSSATSVFVLDSPTLCSSLSLSLSVALSVTLSDSLLNAHTQRLSHKLFLSRRTLCFASWLFISGWPSLMFPSLCATFSSSLGSFGRSGSSSGLILTAAQLVGLSERQRALLMLLNGRRVDPSEEPRVQWQVMLPRVPISPFNLCNGDSRCKLTITPNIKTSGLKLVCCWPVVYLRLDFCVLICLMLCFCWNRVAVWMFQLQISPLWRQVSCCLLAYFSFNQGLIITGFVKQ